jgi:hypothetical protein
MSLAFPTTLFAATLLLASCGGDSAVSVPIDAPETTPTVQGPPTAPPETTRAAQRWEGTIRGDIEPSPNCTAATNTGQFVVNVISRNRVSGSGSVSSSEFSCTSAQGSSTIPPQTSTFTLTGRKEPRYFLLTFSNGQANVRLNHAGGRAHGMTDQSVGPYVARSTLTMRCVAC